MNALKTFFETEWSFGNAFVIAAIIAVAILFAPWRWSAAILVITSVGVAIAGLLGFYQPHTNGEEIFGMIGGCSVVVAAAYAGWLKNKAKTSGGD